MNINLDKLEQWNPFKNVVWQYMDRLITRREIKKSINFYVKHGLKNDFLSVEQIESVRTSRTKEEFVLWIRKVHVERIAFFVLNGIKDPIEIDVGVPSVGCYVSWIIIDGNHRLAAAFYLRLKQIKANVSGSVEYINELLG